MLINIIVLHLTWIQYSTYMKIAVYSKYNDSVTVDAVKVVCQSCQQKKIDVCIFKPENILPFHLATFDNYYQLLNFNPDFLFSIGGDGTLLDSLLVVKDSGIPVVGINTGRLGFLANNQIEEIFQVIVKLENQDYVLENRTVLEFFSDNGLFNEQNFALNEFTIHKGNNSTLITISAFVNNEFFNTYWCDGLILSTPTGSTAYSMSCGGPIVFPDSNTFILTPVAPHNLNVRPVIIPDSTELKFEIQGRHKNFLISLDSRFQIVGEDINFSLRKASFSFKVCKFNNQKFSRILREKLNWGVDKRNLLE